MLAGALQAVVSQVLVKRKEGGRIAVHEIMICNPAVRNLIRENNVEQIYTVIQTNRALGMITMDQAFDDLIAKKLIEPTEKHEEWTRMIR